jgi:uncharacterized damage-inducible protein DinB
MSIAHTPRAIAFLSPALAAACGKMENPRMAHQFNTSYVRDAEHTFRYYKALAERALQQTPDEALAVSLDAESNSIAVIVKHMAGNMRSRWVDFLTSDGEKPDRNRDTEFQAAPETRAEILATWEAGWKYVFDALAPLTDADLGRSVMIRSQPHSVMQAIQRQMAHYSYHVGQVVYLAKHFAGGQWKSLSVPRGQSAEFNARLRAGSRQKE